VDGCIQDDDRIIGECFNDYYIKLVQELSLTFPNIQITQALTCSDAAFEFSLINPEKVEKTYMVVIQLFNNSRRNLS